MGILQRFQKKQPKPLEVTRLPSYMMVVPRDQADIREPKDVVDRLRDALEADPAVEIREFAMDRERHCPTVVLGYREEEYQIWFYPEDFQANGLYQLCHDIPETDMARMEDTVGLTVEMRFHEDAQAGLHLQLKVLTAMVPEALAVVDFSRERVLSPIWAKMAAASQVDPGLDYLFAVQAVYEGGPVWLHSHGLARCGFPELEALNVPKEKVQMVGEMVVSLAEQVIDRGGFPEEDKPVMVSKLSEDDALVVSWRRWERCMQDYPKGTLGLEGDRGEGHNGPSGVLSFYETPEDMERGRRTPLGEFDPERYQHPMQLLTTRETERMQALAVERLEWLRQGFAQSEAKSIVKMGLDQDTGREEEDDFYNGKEHIWFELKELREHSLVGSLINEPYFISGLHEGDELEVELDRLTDWRLYRDGRQITPDEAYLLVLNS